MLPSTDGICIYEQHPEYLRFTAKAIKRHFIPNTTPTKIIEDTANDKGYVVKIPNGLFSQYSEGTCLSHIYVSH